MVAKSHQHSDKPTDDELAKLIEQLHPAQSRLYLQAHRLVLESVPGVAFSVDCEDGAIGYGARQYGYDGWGMAAVAPYAGWVSVAFLRGTSIEDPGGLLEGTGASVRHVKLRSVEELAEKHEPLQRLLDAAARLNER